MSAILYSPRVPRVAWADSPRGFRWRTTIAKIIAPIITRAMTPSMASTISHMDVAPFKETGCSVQNMLYVLYVTMQDALHQGKKQNETFVH
jgi:hypothetical protein